MATEGTKSEPLLREGDLIPDHALTERESDEFKHTEIAARVCDLVTTADPPLNVALFGPWGSGKSSFATLLKKAIAEQHRLKTAFVTYDAWKYSGEALQRSFIAETAEQLGIDDSYFTSQLAQTVERMQLDLKQSSGEQRKALLEWVWRLVVPVVAAVTAIGLVLVVAASIVAGRSISRELLSHAWLVGAPLLVALMAAVLKPVADTAMLKLTEGPPSEERFERRFKDLLRSAAQQHGFVRFVFFIDELDRVAPKDVIATLGIIKNFLDQKNAVFVVAADQQVLERAFKKLPQATPTNEDEPYYSSASEFLDKIFQHQLSLPPLRGQSLYRFAHDLVAARNGGLWEELKNAEAKGERLDDVLYVLIPSHVRSPRRVKVLLNNFATNARIAQSRGIDWLERSREIAKLTVLQTEFPLLAADLHIEPRLPRLVLGTHGFVLAERTRQLLARHAIAVSADETRSDTAEVDEATTEDVHAEVGAATQSLLGATDKLLVPEAEQPKLISVQQENLKRYLIRVDDVPDPSGALLFLEAGGAAEGLADPALGDLLEAEARDDPAAVIAAVRSRATEEQQVVVSVLAGMSEQAHARERSNIITALLDVVGLLDGELGAALQAAAGAVAGYARAGPLEERQLVGALRVGIVAARGAGDTSLRDEVLADDRLLETASRVWAVASLIDELPDEEAERVRHAIAEHLPETTDVLTEPLYVVSPEAAEDLLLHTEIKDAVRTLVDDAPTEEAEKLASFLFETLDRRHVPAPTARLRLMRLLADPGSSSAYAVVREQAQEALDAAGTSQLANDVGLALLSFAPPEDWRLWLPWLDVGQEAFASHDEMGEVALIKIFDQLPQAAEDELDFALEITPLIVRVGRLGDEPRPILTRAIQGALQSGSWWSSEDSFERQEKIHEIVRVLAGACGETTAASLSDLRHQDLVRSATSVGVTVWLFRGIARWAVEMDAAQIRALATMLSPASISGNQTNDEELVGARTHLWMEGLELKEDVGEPPYSLAISDIVAVSRSGSQRGQEIIVDWLNAGVAEGTVSAIIHGIARAPSSIEAEALHSWFKERENADARTEFLTALASGGGKALEWMRVVTARRKRDYSEKVVAHSLVSDAMTATRADERKAAVSGLLALSPRSAEAQRVVGGLIVWLLERDQKVDFEIAISGVQALGSKHAMGRRIGDAFRKACDRDERKIPHRERSAFVDAKIVLGQSYFDEPPTKKGRLSRFLGR